MVLSGGLTKTPELGQILADVFGTTVTLLDSAEEGTAWGAALMAKYRHLVIGGESKTWAEFLDQQNASKTRFEANPEAVKQYETVYRRYKKLIEAHSSIDGAVNYD